MDEFAWHRVPGQRLAHHGLQVLERAWQIADSDDHCGPCGVRNADHGSTATTLNCPQLNAALHLGKINLVSAGEHHIGPVEHRVVPGLDVPVDERHLPVGRQERGNDKVMHVASFSDPLREMDKLHDLYDSLVEARRAAGEEAVPFHKFADLVKTQVKKLKTGGGAEVAFRVAVKDGKVNFTARAMKDGNSED